MPTLRYSYRPIDWIDSARFCNHSHWHWPTSRSYTRSVTVSFSYILLPACTIHETCVNVGESVCGCVCVRARVCVCVWGGVHIQLYIYVSIQSYPIYVPLFPPHPTNIRTNSASFSSLLTLSLSLSFSPSLHPSYRYTDVPLVYSCRIALEFFKAPKLKNCSLYRIEQVCVCVCVCVRVCALLSLSKFLKILNSKILQYSELSNKLRIFLIISSFEKI